MIFHAIVCVAAIAIIASLLQFKLSAVAAIVMAVAVAEAAPRGSSPKRVGCGSDCKSYSVHNRRQLGTPWPFFSSHSLINRQIDDSGPLNDTIIPNEGAGLSIAQTLMNQRLSMPESSQAFSRQSHSMQREPRQKELA